MAASTTLSPAVAALFAKRAAVAVQPEIVPQPKTGLVKTKAAGKTALQSETVPAKRRSPRGSMVNLSV